MSATAFAAPAAAERSWLYAIRMALIGLGIVVMIAVAFALGRVTVGTTHTHPAIAPAPLAVPTAGFTPEGRCRIAGPC
jgi:predicted anti-sigma-YlaC factor YlaD